jgi:glycosyltransferase involved in cell wall biosynthesis
MERAKVIHVITRLDNGGSAQNTLLTAIRHDRARFEPLVVVGDTGPWNDQGGRRATEDNCRRLEKAGVRWKMIPSLGRSIQPLRDVATFWSLVRLFKREQPQVVHTHTSKAGVLGRLAAWIARVPVVVHTPHGHVFYGHFGRIASWLFLQVERLLALMSTKLIALTEAERDEHLALAVGTSRQFAVVPSGIDLLRFRGVAKRRPSWFTCPAGTAVVGSVGWFAPVKGHTFLIEALAKVKTRVPNVCLVLVGNGRSLDDLRTLSKRLGLDQTVQFITDCQEVEQCLAGMDLYVQPSLNEGMGRALIEAMAAGLPVIASKVGGIPAIVADRYNGLLVPPGDAEALAAALLTLLTSPQLAHRLGAAASRTVGERFGAGAMVQAIESQYDQALREAHIA